MMTSSSLASLWAVAFGSGEWHRVGKPEFGKTAFIWSAGNKLYSVETSGTLYEISP